MRLTVDDSFDPIPSLSHLPTVGVTAAASGAEPEAHLVQAEAPLPAGAPTWEELAQVGFEGKAGQRVLLTGQPLRVLVGIDEFSSAALRDAGATAASAVPQSTNLTVHLPAAINQAIPSDRAQLVQALAEGVLLARYRYTPLKSADESPAFAHLTLVSDQPEVAEAARRGAVMARTTNLARDLANTPPRHLNADRLGAVAERLGHKFGLTVEVFGPEQLADLGLGGLLGVNAGSVEEPRMIKVSYRAGERQLALVGKGITYDSGGLSLKPSNPMHALMKSDMLGAGAILAAMTALADLEVDTSVTAWLMCTDNMPSGSSTKLGDVLTIRSGTTVEVKNTDAEGRLVLADGLVLAAESSPDAIVDVATLTGAALAALGPRSAALFANDDHLAHLVEAAAASTDETVWRLPLDARYRDQLKSHVADLSNIGGSYGGAILAALFLNEFVGEVPWAHVDIAGPMYSDQDDLWRVTGSTGFSARLLVELAQTFTTH